MKSKQVKKEKIKIDDTIIFLSEKLETVSKSLESSFKYQVITFSLFISFTFTTITLPENLKIFGVSFDVNLLFLIFPVITLYLLSKMALLTMIFIELSELFFARIKSFSSDKQKNELHRALRPRSIFLAIILTKNNLGERKIKKFLYTFLSSIIYILPGLNMASVLFSILIYQNILLTYVLIPITIGVYTILFMEYNKGIYSKKYRHILYVTYFSMAGFVIALFFLYHLKQI